MPKNTLQAAKSVTKGVISYLKKKHQLNLLPQVAREALKMTRSYSDPNTAVVQSAVSLSPEQVAQLKDILEQKCHRPLTLEVSTNPDLIAGLRIKIGDQLIDQTVAAQINQLRNKLSL
jgi:F-type H+-transporting ATPase subunit delta